ENKSAGANAIPRSLYLPDGRIIPTCVIQAKPDERLPGPSLGPFNTSLLLGVGYSCFRNHQVIHSFGPFACLPYQSASSYPLTDRCVGRGAGEGVRGVVRSSCQPLGASGGVPCVRPLMSSVFPRYPAADVYLPLESGLLRIGDINDWSAQVFGIGEIGELFNA